MRKQLPGGVVARKTPAAADTGADPAIDAALLETWALSYLGRYASSSGMLRRVLQRRAWRRGGEPAMRAAGPAIEELLVRYRASGLIDDTAYAASRAEAELARGRPLGRIAAALAAKGIATADAAAVLRSLREQAGDPDLAAAGEFARRRRLGPFRTGLPDPSRELAAFARAGFGRRESEAVLECADPPALAALLAGSGE